MSALVGNLTHLLYYWFALHPCTAKRKGKFIGYTSREILSKISSARCQFPRAPALLRLSIRHRVMILSCR